MPFVRSFPPVADTDARVLVLGSMPGVASLQAARYYAHPHNAFWPILGGVCGFEPDAGYRQRLVLLRRAGIALWDVLHSCAREGSLDSDIEAESAQPNDIAGFLAEHRQVRAVLCNGGTAFRLFVRHVRRKLPPVAAALPISQLPSTSPAHASMKFADKLAAWRNALSPHLR